MPTYQFRCDSCNKRFDLTLTLAEHEKKRFTCPKCKSRKVRQELTTFAPNTSKHILVRKSVKSKPAAEAQTATKNKRATKKRPAAKKKRPVTRQRG